SADGRKMWLDRFSKMHDSAAWKDILAKQGWEDAYLAGDDFVSFLNDEKTRIGAILKDAGLVK
ncbi:MAG TPA: tripartite tricarboxylate transporter substrate binding protein, partial [Shinella sp.]|nr:tripartite tricarboxylate transporter substrate binding protein [Shinella sp.]